MSSSACVTVPRLCLCHPAVYSSTGGCLTVEVRRQEGPPTSDYVRCCSSLTLTLTELTVSPADDGDLHRRRRQQGRPLLPAGSQRRAQGRTYRARQLPRHRGARLNLPLTLTLTQTLAQLRRTLTSR